MLLTWALVPVWMGLTASIAAAPSVHITASRTEGTDSLSVELGCDCAAGAAPLVAYQWDLGEGWRVNTPTARQTFGPGRHFVSLVVVDALGVRTRDDIEIVVKDQGQEPPRCAARVSLSRPYAPADVTWEGTQAKGSNAIAKAYWVASNGRVAETAAMIRTGLTAGWHTAVWVVEDVNGLQCRFRQEAVVYDGEANALAQKAPPRIVSVATHRHLACAEPYEYGEETVLRASGEGTQTWTLLQGPTGMTLDSKTGEVTWVPTPDDRGEKKIVFQVATEYGTDAQDTSADVACATEMELQTPFGCSTAPGFPIPIGLALLALLHPGMFRSRR